MQGILRNIQLDRRSVSAVQSQMMRAMCEYLEVPIPETFTLVPVNSIAVLVHWRILMMLSLRLETEHREYWKEQYPAPAPEKPAAYDAHFHLERTISAMHLEENATLQEILDGTPVEDGKEVKLVGSCASFCDPDTYPSLEYLHSTQYNGCCSWISS